MSNISNDNNSDDSAIVAEDDAIEANISEKLHLFKPITPGENVDFNDDGTVDYKDHALLGFVKIALSTFSGIILVGALVFIVLANSFMSFSPLTFNNGESVVGVPSYSASSVCDSALAVDSDLSNDEDFGGMKSEIQVNTELSAIGNTDSMAMQPLDSNDESDETVSEAGEDNVFADQSNIITLSNTEKDASVTSSVFENTDKVPFTISGVKTVRTADGDLQGVAAAKCVQPSTDFWFIGGGTDVQTTTKLLVANPTNSATQVKITVWGDDNSAGTADDGSLKYAASRYEGINANTEKAILLSSGAPNQKIAAVHVETASNPFSAIISTQSLSGLTPNGVEYINNTELTKSAIIPEFSVLSDEKSNNVLELVAPKATGDIEVSADFTNTTTKKTVNKKIKVKKGLVSGEELKDLDAGKYTVQLTSDTEFLTTIEQKVKYDGGAIDIAYYNPAPLASSAFLPLSGATTVNVFRSSDDLLSGSKISQIRVRTFDSSGKTITSKSLDIKENSTVQVPHELIGGAAFIFIQEYFENEGDIDSDDNSDESLGTHLSLAEDIKSLAVSETWAEEKGVANIVADIPRTRVDNFTFSFNNIG